MKRSLVKAAQVLAVLTAALLFMCSTASALLVGGNIDVHNNTGLVVNDFHVTGEVWSTWGPACDPTLTAQFGYVGDPGDPANWFPTFNHTITHLVGNRWAFEATWSGLNVPNSSVGHFGLFFDVCGFNVYVDLDGWWTVNGEDVGGWPMPGFDVPGTPDDLPSEQVFQLLPDAGETRIDTRLIQVDMMLTDPPANIEQFLGLLNVEQIGQIEGEWLQVDESTSDEALPFDLVEGSMFEISLERLGGMEPDQILVVRTLVEWQDEPAGRWYFHLHQVPPRPTSVNMEGKLEATWGALKASYR
jgi:hypothetical protein